VARADQVQPDRGRSHLSVMTDKDREFVDFFADEYWPLRRLGFAATVALALLLVVAVALTGTVCLRAPGRAHGCQRAARLEGIPRPGGRPQLPLPAGLGGPHRPGLGSPLGDRPSRVPRPQGDKEHRMTWRWAWQNWCRQPLGQTGVRVEAVDAGKSAIVQAPPREDATNCQGLGRDTPWRISPWP
jgi:hypothetical protein